MGGAVFDIRLVSVSCIGECILYSPGRTESTAEPLYEWASSWALSTVGI
jgi:hypothetical protein